MYKVTCFTPQGYSTAWHVRKARKRDLEFAPDFCYETKAEAEVEAARLRNR